MAVKALHSLIIVLLITTMQAKESLNLLEVQNDLESVFSEIIKASDSIKKECQNLGSFSGRLSQICEAFEFQSSLFSETKTQFPNFIKHYYELNDPPVREFVSLTDPKLVSLLHAKLSANAIVSERIPITNQRYSSYYELTQLLLTSRPQIFVETGTARDGLGNCHNDGCSTAILGKIAQTMEAKLYSVDINPEACRRAREACQPFGNIVEVIEGDSVSYLNSFNAGLIDFLYLDSYDFEFGNPNPSQEHHKKELAAAYNKLHKKSIVMVDDCRLPDGGKCPLVRDFLFERGWTLYFSSYQQIFVYEK